MFLFFFLLATNMVGTINNAPFINRFYEYRRQEEVVLLLQNFVSGFHNARPVFTGERRGKMRRPEHVVSVDFLKFFLRFAVFLD